MKKKGEKNMKNLNEKEIKCRMRGRQWEEEKYKEKNEKKDA